MGECSYNALRPCSLAQSPLQDDHSALSKCVRYLPTSGRLVYRAGVMSKVDPKGYYACLGVEPWANADQIRAAFHRGARLYHPDHNPSPQAKARFQAINEAYRTLSNPTTRRAYDRSRGGAPAGGHGTDLGPVRWRRTELDAG